MTYEELVIDTNILLSDGSALKKFGKKILNIPFVVLQELDKHKTSPGDIGVNARRTIRFLDTLREQGDLRAGVPTPEGAIVKVILEEAVKGWSPDDQIIEAASKLYQNNIPVTLISNDINLRVKASLKGVPAQGRHKNKSDSDESEDFKGVSNLEVSGDVIDQLHNQGRIALPGEKQYFPNEFVHLIDENNSKHTSVGRVIDDITIKKMLNIKDVFGIKPKNLEQSCAVDLIMDLDIPLVTLMGVAGTGKTLIALASALELVLTHKDYDKLIIMRPPIPMGKDIGFLPGSLEEKMSVWLGPIMDNFEMLMSYNQRSSFEYMLEAGIIEVMPPTYIRGRSLANSILLVDEAQSLNLHEAKTIVTRMHETSKLIMTGDIRQIDNPQLSAEDNGFTCIVEAFKEYNLAGHITLEKCERGSLASLAAEIL